MLSLFLYGFRTPLILAYALVATRLSGRPTVPTVHIQSPRMESHPVGVTPKCLISLAAMRRKMMRSMRKKHPSRYLQGNGQGQGGIVTKIAHAQLVPSCSLLYTSPFCAISLSPSRRLQLHAAARCVVVCFSALVFLSSWPCLLLPCCLFVFS